MIRSEYLKWCKQRALEVLEKDGVVLALTSMVSDLGNHDETMRHDGIDLGMKLMLKGNLSTPEQMRKFIEDFS